MSMMISLDTGKLVKLRENDLYIQSYNIEMTELTGGTFWTPYTPEQVSGEEEYPVFSDMGDQELEEAMKSIECLHPAINLYHPRIRTLAKAFGPVIIRYSGSWATRTYYDFDGHTHGIVPDGFEYILTEEQWKGALDFAREIGAKIMVSVANSKGVHKDGKGEWMPDQAKILWDYTASQGMKIDYAEFMNEPNMACGCMLPDNYSAEYFGRDHDLFAAWLKENHPETILVGPCCCDTPKATVAGGIANLMIRTDDIMKNLSIMPDIFSYHSYTCISERGQMFGFHYPASMNLSEEYLGATMGDLEYFKPVRDQYMPGSPMWITESADAACGGNTWAPTFVEAIRYVDELARFSLHTDGVVFHNTFASGAYGWLDSRSYLPRPQYWAALLFKRLAGKYVYDTKEEIREGAHVYAYSRKDEKEGYCYLIINNSKKERLTVNVPDCQKYILTSSNLRSEKIMLNGKILEMEDEYTLPELQGDSQKAGRIELPVCSVSFIII